MVLTMRKQSLKLIFLVACLIIFVGNSFAIDFKAFNSEQVIDITNNPINGLINYENMTDNILTDIDYISCFQINKSRLNSFARIQPLCPIKRTWRGQIIPPIIVVLIVLQIIFSMYIRVSQRNKRLDSYDLTQIIFPFLYCVYIMMSYLRDDIYQPQNVVNLYEGKHIYILVSACIQSVSILGMPMVISVVSVIRYYKITSIVRYNNVFNKRKITFLSLLIMITIILSVLPVFIGLSKYGLFPVMSHTGSIILGTSEQMSEINIVKYIWLFLHPIGILPCVVFQIRLFFFINESEKLLSIFKMTSNRSQSLMLQYIFACFVHPMIVLCLLICNSILSVLTILKESTILSEYDIASYTLAVSFFIPLLMSNIFKFCTQKQND